MNVQAYLNVRHTMRNSRVTRTTLREEILADKPTRQIWHNLVRFILTGNQKINFGGNWCWRIAKTPNFWLKLFWWNQHSMIRLKKKTNRSTSKFRFIFKRINFLLKLIETNSKVQTFSSNELKATLKRLRKSTNAEANLKAYLW